MRLKKVWIKNFRCCQDLEIHIGSMHALVGANNAGKSSILKALDFLFNPSASKISDEVFWCNDLTTEIRVEASFTDLTEHEQEEMAANLRPDGSLMIARTASYGGEGNDEEESDSKIKIGVHYKKAQPKLEWLRESEVTAANIKEWLKNKDELVVNGKSFIDYFDGGKPTVGDWKTKAVEFASTALGPDDLEDAWVKNPKGFPNVLKANLPHFELIPAVRDASDESKVLKTNPFGRLIHEIMSSLDEGVRSEIGTTLKNTIRKLNREGGQERLDKISEVEGTMKTFLSELMPADFEIEFQAPTVEVLLSTPKIFIDDGYRGAIEGKGHGLQRAVIFSILRCYAELVMTRTTKGKRTLILAVEEPELYMHPTAQRTIRKVLRTVADGKDQVLFTTHSPLLVDVAYFDEIIRVEAANKDDQGVMQGAKIHQLPMHRMVDDLKARVSEAQVTSESIRERYSHAYTPTRNEGFFAKRVILVEGQTESYCLPIYSSALGHEFDLLGVAVIECGGKEQIDRLYRIFNELGIACYVLFDFDKDDADAVRSSKNLLAFLKHEPDAPANVIIHDSFACFVKKWEIDLVGEIPDYEILCTAAHETLGKVGKPLQARYVANALISQDPPVVPGTLRKIIEKAIAVKHSGTCLHELAKN